MSEQRLYCKVHRSLYAEGRDLQCERDRLAGTRPGRGICASVDVFVVPKTETQGVSLDQASRNPGLAFHWD